MLNQLLLLKININKHPHIIELETVVWNLTYILHCSRMYIRIT